MSNWLPIETAPDGVYFLAHSHKGWIGVARRTSSDYDPGWFEDERSEFIDPSWLSHWMPLPEPPALGSKIEV